MFLKKLLGFAPASSTRGAEDLVEYPLEAEQKFYSLHGRAATDAHLNILFKDNQVGGENFAELYRRCLAHTGTVVTPFNVFHRFQSRHTLLQYFYATLSLPGARVECGAYRGATALLMCHAWRSRVPEFDGKDCYLVDSFSGTGESGMHDLIPVRDAHGRFSMQPFFPPGKTDVDAAMVRNFFGAFPQVEIRNGWIPHVLEELPDRDWSFVHIDVTLHDATLAALEYFYPRLNRRGVIICDGSIFCPGAQKAVETFCGERNIPFVMLGNRESVIIKQ